MPHTQPVIVFGVKDVFSSDDLKVEDTSMGLTQRYIEDCEDDEEHGDERPCEGAKLLEEEAVALRCAPLQEVVVLVHGGKPHQKP